MLGGITKLIQEHTIFRDYSQNLIKHDKFGQMVHGLAEVQQSYWVAAANAAVRNKTLLVVTETLHHAKTMAYDLSNFFPEGQVDYLPPRETLLHGVYARSHEISESRMKILSRLTRGEITCLLVPVESLMQKMPPKDIFESAHIPLKEGTQLLRDDLLEKLLWLGYERVDLVQAPGQFSIRGDICDLYPVNEKKPVRLDFFDDEVEKIRVFDPISQRSEGRIDKLVLSPAKELIIDSMQKTRALDRLLLQGNEYINQLEKKGKRTAARRLKDSLDEWSSKLENNLWAADMEKLQPFFYEKQDSLIEYFPSTPLIFISEAINVIDAISRVEEEHLNNLTELLALGRALPEFKEMDFSSHLVKEWFAGGNTTYLAMLPRSIHLFPVNHVVTITGKSVPPFYGKTSLLLEEVRSWKKRGYVVYFVVSSLERARRLKNTLAEERIEIPIINAENIAAHNFSAIVVGNISKGFELPDMKLAVISDEEIFGTKKMLRTPKNFKDGTKISHLGELKVGDYVVHVQHGIGKYLGIEHLRAGGIERDYMNLQYAGQDKLYVPTDQVELIQKYIGSEGHKPKLHKLGGTDWQKIKSRVKASVQEIARQLLGLYAERETIKGFAFSQDDTMQREFEETFPYVETPDQLHAIEKTKEDMQGHRPMDRLICGDVGYGKTEVALRAAYKAVSDSKQVAVLVPTTVLAQQHYKTFSDRFAGFPVTVDTLSRFKTAKEQKIVIDGLKKGNVDIVIGTHRLLSADILFKDLGLLVIDEEQRFGVTHKERIKQIRKNVDVLTLTATPIPRTMHMALAGVRDMSVIETPPEDRYPIQTYVVEYSENLVRDAIRKELDREGQIYYIHNRIESMDKVKKRLVDLFPDISIGVAHGRMPEDQLEDVMLRFIEGEHRILVCTTIIENGLDISNVNTLIVEDADKLGLAQLYQIRGRVGRTSRLAYAYFTYKKNKILNRQAEKRLAAIREFTEFGSGFKIAKRDLEIRGAGNILGSEQHGHMLAIGFDLYSRLLEDAVSILQGKQEVLREENSVELELKISAFIPEKYIPDNSQIMDVYQGLATAESANEVEKIREDLLDRFGSLPLESEQLIALARIKVMAKQLRIKKVRQGKEEVELVFEPDVVIKGEKLLALARGMDRRISFSVARGLVMKIRIARLSQKEILDLIAKLMFRLDALEVKD